MHCCAIKCLCCNTLSWVAELGKNFLWSNDWWRISVIFCIFSILSDYHVSVGFIFWCDGILWPMSKYGIRYRLTPWYYIIQLSFVAIALCICSKAILQEYLLFWKGNFSLEFLLSRPCCKEQTHCSAKYQEVSLSSGWVVMWLSVCFDKNIGPSKRGASPGPQSSFWDHSRSCKTRCLEMTNAKSVRKRTKLWSRLPKKIVGYAESA